MNDSVAPVTLTLEERKARIDTILDRSALDIGEELAAAKAEHPEVWRSWVDENLPFGLATAERLVAVHKAFALTPPEQRAMLPKARTSLYELTALPPERLRRAIDSGEVNPDMTMYDARKVARPPRPRPEPPMPSQRVERKPIPKVSLTANVVAQELMRFQRAELDEVVLVALRRWLGPEWQWEIDEQRVKESGATCIEIPEGVRLVDVDR
jgi:hypothetical protein